MAIEQKKVKPESNVYTALLVAACLAVLSTAVYVTITCYNQYETIFKVVKP